MREIIPLLALLVLLLVLLPVTVLVGGQAAQLEHPAELLKLAQDFQEWRAPPDGIADYADRAARQIAELREFQERLSRLPDVRGFSVHAQVDYLLLRSQMDAEVFRLHVLRPWSRSPVFYTQTAIGNVRRHLIAGRRVRPGTVPYTRERAQAILKALAETEAILSQAPGNLTEAVPELADMALRHPGGGYLIDFDKSRGLKDIEQDYADWVQLMKPHFPEPAASELGPAAARAGEALSAFGEWLEESREQMSGSYVLGKDTYTWHLRRVRLVPHGADELLAMAAMERARALSFFQFEQFKNRNLPQIGPAETAEEYLAWDDETSLRIRRFYKDLLTEPDYALPVKSSVGLFQPPFGEMYFPERQEDAQGGTPEKPARRIIIYPVDHWKWRYSNMGFRTAPGALHMHEYYPGHYLERELHRRNPCPVRRGHRDPVHSQGWCFYNEEMPLMLDFPYVRGPRAREQVYVNMYQRSLRVLQGIRLLDGQLTVNEALEWLTDRLPPNLGPSLGARPEEAFEETYPVIERGTTDTCMLGLTQIYRLLADRRMQLADRFDFREFHDQFLALGSIPIALSRWEMTGLDDEMEKLWQAASLPLPDPPGNEP